MGGGRVATTQTEGGEKDGRRQSGHTRQKSSSLVEESGLSRSMPRPTAGSYSPK